MNPIRNKNADTANPSRVAAVILHLPEMESEYHKHRFDVIRLSLMSMANYCNDAAVMVWDNGSCELVREWLRNEYKPDYLMLSHNIGKQSARANIMHSFPIHTIIGISDDDMLFYPDWFDESVKILDGFPNVGLVSGYPVRTQFRWGCENTIKWARSKAFLEAGIFIPEEYDYDFCVSIGREYDWHRQYTAHDIDYRITYKRLQAYATGHHCQFIAYNDRLAPLCTWNDTAMGEEKTFDKSIDDAGLLRLTTIERYSRHIGNVIDPSIYKAAVNMKLIQEAVI